jgi:hypothetical protein
MTKDNIDPGEFEWGRPSTDDEGQFTGQEQTETVQGSITRRSAQAVRAALPEIPRPERQSFLAASVALMVSIGMLFALSGGATAAATFTAGDVQVTTDNGQITSVTVAPNGTVTYDGLEASANTITVDVQVKKNSSTSWETVGSKTLSPGGTSGSATYNFTNIDVIQNSPLTTADFNAGGDGTSTATDVDVRVHVTLVGVGDSGADVTTSAGDTFTVTANNQPISVDVSGQANTGAS